METSKSVTLLWHDMSSVISTNRFKESPYKKWVIVLTIVVNLGGKNFCTLPKIMIITPKMILSRKAIASININL